MMDELEFRRRCYTDPGDPELEQACKESQEHFRAYSAARRFDQQTRDALEVPAPEGLAGRILLAQSLDDGPPARARQWLASAAAVAALATGLVLLSPDTPLPLNEVALNHIHNELHHLHEPGVVPASEVSQLLAEFNASVGDSLPQVTYAGPCDIRDKPGIHMVLNGQRGPVTLLIMPGQPLTADLAVGDDRFQGRVVPTSTGSMAIVGNPDEDIDRIEQQVRDAITWRT